MTTEWAPTTRLRFRSEWVSDERAQRILQQEWRREITNDWNETEVETEWRDVPLCKDA